MKLTKRQIIGYSALAVSIGAIIYVINNKKKNEVMIKQIISILDGKTEDPSNPKMGGQVVIKQNEIEKLPMGNYPLKIGDKNKKVHALQQLLNTNFGSNLDLDGKFGQGMYSVLCDNYWSVCGASVGLYKRTISQSDVDEIKKMRR
jgi:hypothetical protein